MKPEAGNALLITMVVITVIGTVGFGVSRIALSSLRNQNRLEDSASAYQAASAGIEDALLRWRFNKHVELPAVGSISGCTQSPNASSSAYTRVNLTRGTIDACINPDEVVPPNVNEIAYDLKISFKRAPGEPEIVDSLLLSSGQSVPGLARDEVAEYSVKDIVAQGGDIKLQIVPEVTSLVNNLLEIIMLDDHGAQTGKRLVTGAELSAMVSMPSPVRIVAGTSLIRLKYYGQDLRGYTVYPPESLGTSGEGAVIDSRITNIESIGYFGGTKRKLQLSLDRFSGSTLQMFDFVLFSSGGSDIAPSQ